MKTHIVINNKLYKLKAIDTKRLEDSTKDEIMLGNGNNFVRTTTLKTDEILLDILSKYKPIATISATFNI